MDIYYIGTNVLYRFKTNLFGLAYIIKYLYVWIKKKL